MNFLSGKIQLSIDWTQLFNKPFEANVCNVYVLLTPANNRKFNAEIRSEIEAALKNQMLASLTSHASDDKSKDYIAFKCLHDLKCPTFTYIHTSKRRSGAQNAAKQNGWSLSRLKNSALVSLINHIQV